MTDISPTPATLLAEQAAGTGRAGRSPAGRVLRFAARRWPAWCGLAMAVLSLLDLEDGRGQAVIVFLAALIYLGTAIVGKPGVVWILFGASVVAITVLRVFQVDPWVPLIGGAVALLVLGLVSDLPRQPRLAAAQLPAMVVFGGAALTALSLSPAFGSYLVAAALIGHATLDTIVWRADKVVIRSLAEFCAVLDLTLGLLIIALQLI
ncbi:hypothetical protein GBF35_38210 [Nonomuraea phyllanthi]|uniref:hypothetical protein n=1 Tax=Nonomuraea phyllanthi TaxID=2219224 RepID=UPI001292F77A|nr:hypothetical protein [Nonomuraea phyllanthi]QFY11644.1 hypothetical protein GBF35_38210 [Nonomuraea phyllanthi]